MKFTKEHLLVLKKEIDPILEKYPNLVQEYENGLFPRADKVKDLQRRFCFDIFWSTGIKIGDGIGTSGDIIGDYTHDHIYTAVKSLCPKVVRKY